MSGTHDPPETFQFNKLRESKGSHRLTLVKDAVDAAEIDPRPPRSTLALVPVGDGAWVGFDVARYDSQQTRVGVRAALTDVLAPGTRVVGEFPVSLRGKLGSTVVVLPALLVEELDLADAERATTVAAAPGLLLFVTGEKAAAPETDIAAALDAARQALPDR